MTPWLAPLGEVMHRLTSRSIPHRLGGCPSCRDLA